MKFNTIKAFVSYLRELDHSLDIMTIEDQDYSMLPIYFSDFCFPEKLEVQLRRRKNKFQGDLLSLIQAGSIVLNEREFVRYLAREIYLWMRRLHSEYFMFTAGIFATYASAEDLNCYVTILREMTRNEKDKVFMKMLREHLIEVMSSWVLCTKSKSDVGFKLLNYKNQEFLSNIFADKNLLLYEGRATFDASLLEVGLWDEKYHYFPPRWLQVS